MKYEWFPWYPSDFKADTMHLTAEQDGVYRRLIDHYMETEQPLPDSDIALARIAGVSDSCFKQNSSTILAFFRQENNRLYHKKCEEILNDMDERSKKRSDRARKGGYAKANKAIETKHISASSKQQVEHKQCLNMLPNPTLPNPTVIKKEYRSKGNFEEFWSACPRKVGKGNAMKKYDIALRETTHDDLMKCISLHAQEMKEKEREFIPHPATWLSQQRYLDEIPKHLKTTSDWPAWKKSMAEQIGENATKSWFDGCEVNGIAIKLKNKFQVDYVKSNFMEAVKNIFGPEFEVQY